MITTTPIHVLLAEDHALMRRGLLGQFSLESDFEVVGEAENGQQAIELAKQLHPDQFEDVDPQATLDGFFAKYMPIQFNGTYMTQLK